VGGLFIGETMWKLIGQIVLEGVQLWSEERRTRFMDEYKDILDRITEAENAKPPIYTDSELDLAEQERMNFLEAYHTELKAINHEKKS
jgi:hypothetical protein